MFVGYAEGRCCRCGKMFYRPRPINVAVCDCWQYCPVDHGKGAYGTLMIPYDIDLTPQTYGPIKIVSGNPHGDLKQPMKILCVCPVCQYHSAQQPVKVHLE